ncbi:ABC-three component system middle component 7 [uncultured Shewanella sp.]|uniref:ABC-three component system middle component 7 n=1 Tax=uncultured Shewanella sp. TaxID=173975 RepID=UPI0026241237|nr:ABC-three component system middle component 7 [uncultured Shewanella sp.]
MITPSKTIPLKESIIFKMTYILDVEFEETSLSEIYKKTKAKFIDLEEFIYAIDILFVLGKIEVNLDLGKVKKC